MFEEMLRIMQAYDTIVIHRHSNPDGDALGSQIGLKHLLQDNYPGKIVYMTGDEAGMYAFMKDSVMDTVEDSVFPQALSVILDTSGKTLISDGRYEKAAATARIDHHLYLGQIAQTEVIDSSFESCCGLIAQMAVECHWKVSDLAAESLYIGMVTDSGRFRYDSTSARTFRLAAMLMEHDFDTNEIYRALYAKPFSEIQLRARFVEKIRTSPRGVGYIYTTREELRQLGDDLFLISRGMVNVMGDIQGMDIWVNFTESDEGVVCELRSSRYNINPIAVDFGGGGHEKASGATVRDRDTAMRMLAALDQMLPEA